MVANNTNAPLRVAVVGAGVVGLALTAGLLAHGIDVVLYEQATTLKEIGTGIGLLPTAVTAIEALSPSMAEAMKRISFQLSFRLGVVNSASNEDLFLRQEGGLCDLVVPDEQGQIMHTMARAALATTLLDHVPKERLKLGKKVVNVVSTSASDPVRLVFADGTTAEADAVVACDCVKSRIRRVMLGDAHPGSLCQYAHEVCYRALVDSSALRSILGPLADVTAIYLAPGAYLIVYPVGVRPNISVYVHDASHSPPRASQSHGRVAPRAELAAVLSKLGPNIRARADILPEEVSVWALHDLLEHPLATYAFGRVCLAGDAAHAATSHHGAGAGIGVEDAAVLCKLLERVKSKVASGSKVSEAAMIETALGLYDAARRERSQWVVWSSRRQGELMKCMVPEIGNDLDKIEADLIGRTRRLLDCDVHATLERALRELDERIAAMEA